MLKGNRMTYYAPTLYVVDIINQEGDALGTLQGEVEMWAGSGSQTGFP